MTATGRAMGKARADQTPVISPRLLMEARPRVGRNPPGITPLHLHRHPFHSPTHRAWDRGSRVILRT